MLEHKERATGEVAVSAEAMADGAEQARERRVGGEIPVAHRVREPERREQAAAAEGAGDALGLEARDDLEQRPERRGDRVGRGVHAGIMRERAHPLSRTPQAPRGGHRARGPGPAPSLTAASQHQG